MVAADTFDHGNDPLVLLVQRYRACPGARTLAANIQDVGPFVNESYGMLDGSFVRSKLPAVARRCRCGPAIRA